VYDVAVNYLFTTFLIFMEHFLKLVKRIAGYEDKELYQEASWSRQRYYSFKKSNGQIINSVIEIADCAGLSDRELGSFLRKGFAKKNKSKTTRRRG